MHRNNSCLPLAFLLALAADGASAASVGSSSAPVLTRGMLADLLEGTETSSMVGSLVHSTVNRELAQIPGPYIPGFRNIGFFNCFNGPWRNC
jgi:hypothetical protein